MAKHLIGLRVAFIMNIGSKERGGVEQYTYIGYTVELLRHYTSFIQRNT